MASLSAKTGTNQECFMLAPTKGQKFCFRSIMNMNAQKPLSAWSRTFVSKQLRKASMQYSIGTGLHRTVLRSPFRSIAVAVA